jgi:WD40 repeat protein
MKENKIEPVCESEKCYYGNYQNSFLVLDGEKTVIGVDDFNSKRIFIECMTIKDSRRQIGKHEARVNCLELSANQKILLAGDKEGTIVQYFRHAAFGFVKINEYSGLRFDNVHSLRCVGHLFLVGGTIKKKGTIRIISTYYQKPLDCVFETDLGEICSLEVWALSPSKVQVTATGQYKSLSEIKRKCLNFTEIPEKDLVVQTLRDWFHSISRPMTSQNYDFLHFNFGRFEGKNQETIR